MSLRSLAWLIQLRQFLRIGKHRPYLFVAEGDELSVFLSFSPVDSGDIFRVILTSLVTHVILPLAMPLLVGLWCNKNMAGFGDREPSIPPYSH